MKVKKVKQACSACSGEDSSQQKGEDKEIQERRVKVAHILKDVEHYRTKEAFEEAVNTFVNCALSIEEIEGLAVRLRPDYLTVKDMNNIEYKNTRAVGIY